MTSNPARKTVLFVGVPLAAVLSLAFVAQVHRDGYRNTPILPGQKWHVHDPDRPYPHEVVPSAAPGGPPSDATVLFDGKDLSQWTQYAGGAESTPKWKVAKGCIEIGGGTGNLYTKEKFGDCQLHIEYQEDKNVKGSGQGRGNSGVFLMSKYEVQVLDSYRASTYADGQAGALYGQYPPLVNPMRPPGEWQAYDIIFTAPKFEGTKVVEPAYVTLFFNGVMVHNHQKLNGPSAHQAVLMQEVQPAEDHIYLQDHGPSKLKFRNIWIRRLKGYDQPEEAPK